MLAGVVNLVNLAQGQEFAEASDFLDDADVAGGDGLLERGGDEEVADENGDMVVPDGVDCGLVAAEFRFVDNVVVNQGGVVEQFDGGCGAEEAFVGVGIASEAAAEQHDDGSDLFAFCGEVGVNNMVHQRVTGRQFTPNQGVEPVESGLKARAYCVELSHVFKNSVQNYAKPAT